LNFWQILSLTFRSDSIDTHYAWNVLMGCLCQGKHLRCFWTFVRYWRNLFHARITFEGAIQKPKFLLFPDCLDTNTYAFIIPPPKLHKNFRKACGIVCRQINKQIIEYHRTFILLAPYAQPLERLPSGTCPASDQSSIPYPNDLYPPI